MGRPKKENIEYPTMVANALKAAPYLESCLHEIPSDKEGELSSWKVKVLKPNGKLHYVAIKSALSKRDMAKTGLTLFDPKAEAQRDKQKTKVSSAVLQATKAAQTQLDAKDQEINTKAEENSAQATEIEELKRLLEEAKKPVETK